MENFKDFYKRPSVENLKTLIEQKRLTNDTLYEFLDGYSKYHAREISLDNF